jgi:hypothetical protein
MLIITEGCGPRCCCLASAPLETLISIEIMEPISMAASLTMDCREILHRVSKEYFWSHGNGKIF